jgi:UDP-glucose:(glucosyl)LPS alpha-1,2-glucosyltransferase
MGRGNQKGVMTMGGIDWNEISAKANGGTELMARELEQHVPRDLLDEFQIFLTRFTSADPEKIRILWCHNSPGGSEDASIAYGGWRRFHRLVFVSNWQARAYVQRYDIPPSRCHVLPNAIRPIAIPGERRDRPAADRRIRLIYTSTPDRGLDILLTAFNEICEQRDDVELDVFSSFTLYGWDDHDRAHRGLFDALRQNPRIRYQGAVPHRQLRRAVARADVFAYPSVWPETSCRCLMEAMSAGLACVHPDIAALPETAAGHTVMYPWHPSRAAHAAVFRDALTAVVDGLKTDHPLLRSSLEAQKRYADAYYSWEVRAWQWEDYLRGLVDARRGWR